MLSTFHSSRVSSINFYNFFSKFNFQFLVINTILKNLAIPAARTAAAVREMTISTKTIPVMVVTDELFQAQYEPLHTNEKCGNLFKYFSEKKMF